MEPEELLKQIDYKLRLGKLDSLFLLVPTLLGVVSSLFQYYLGILKQQSDICFSCQLS